MDQAFKQTWGKLKAPQLAKEIVEAEKLNDLSKVLRLNNYAFKYGFHGLLRAEYHKLATKVGA